jgi:HEAT repeat protein
VDDVEQLFAAFRARAMSAAASKLDVLIDLERLNDPRIVPFLLLVLIDREEPTEVRIHVVKRLRNGPLASESRGVVARAIIQILEDGSNPDLRLHAALALAEFTDVEAVAHVLGSLALEVTEPLDLRYSAFTSLERAGPTPECVALLRQLVADETLGRSARSLLSMWQLE